MCEHRGFHGRGSQDRRRLSRQAGTVMALAAVAALSVFDPAPVRAQTPASVPPVAAQDAGPVRQLGIDDAVALALEQNLDLQVERINPQIQDLAVSVARSGWTPSFQSEVQTTTSTNPADSFLSGATGAASTIDNDRFTSNLGVGALLPWGASYNVGWASGRQTTNNEFSNFSPRLDSTFTFNYAQPLLRNLSIDNTRQQLLVSRKNREISDVQLQQVVAATTRNVKNAYWDLVYAIDNLTVQRESLELAQRSLKDNRARVEIGTMAPIDIIQAEAEVAQREESVILAEASIGRAEDRLRALIYDPSSPDFWTQKLQPTDQATFIPVPVDADAAIRTALDRRTDLVRSRKQIEANDVNIRYYRNQALPDINAIVDYSAIGIGGTQFQRGEGFPGPVTGQTQRSFGSVLQDAFGNAFPTWTFALQLNYPIGTSNSEAALARARLQNAQAQKELGSQQLQVATEIRDLARSVQTNAKRVEATRASRALAEKRLESEEKKFQAGMTESFFVVQAQRDLNQARNNELQAIIDHLKSTVDFETAQLAPVTGSGSVSAVTVTSTGSSATSTARPPQ